MTVCVVGVTIGLVAGLLTGGHLRAIGTVPVRMPLTTFGALTALVLIRAGFAGDAGMLLLTALSILAGAAIANRHLAGLGVVAVGLMANLAPVLFDGGTPVDPRALEAVGIAPAEAQLAPSQHLATDHTSVPALSAQIPIPFAGVVVSFGDLIVAVGLAATARNATRVEVRAGIPVSEILASGPLSIGEPATPSIARRGTDPTPRPERRTVRPRVPVSVPAGWERSDTAW